MHCGPFVLNGQKGKTMVTRNEAIYKVVSRLDDYEAGYISGYHIAWMDATNDDGSKLDKWYMAVGEWFDANPGATFGDLQGHVAELGRKVFRNEGK